MASSYSSLNFDGQLRVDANHAMNPQYAPNSFTNKFRPDTAEAPYQLADPNVSRKSHFFHEGKDSEYDQARNLYMNAMDAQARQHLHANTARLLKLVEYPEIQVKYLAQAFRIAPEYAKGIYNLLPEKRFAFEEVQGRAGEEAEKWGKEAKSGLVLRRISWWASVLPCLSIIPEMFPVEFHCASQVLLVT
jgi:catalase